MKKILSFYVKIFMALWVVSFLPIVTDQWGTGRTLLLEIGAMIGLVIWGATLLLGKSKTVYFGKGLGLILVWAIWGTICLTTAGKGVTANSWLASMGVGMMWATAVWVFLWLQVRSKEEIESQVNWLTIAGLVAGVLSIVVFLVPNSKLPWSFPKNNPIITVNQNWSMVGSIQNELLLIVFLVFEWVRRLIKKLKSEDGSGFLKEAIITAVLGLVVFLNIYKWSKAGWVALDRNSGWVIAAETLKKHALTGVGPGNFIEAFYASRPTTYNLTKYWSSAFVNSTNGILNIWTEMGIGGLLLILWLILGWLKMAKKVNFWETGLFLAAFLFLPVTAMAWWLIFWLVTNRVYEKEEGEAVLKVGENGYNVMPIVMGVVVVAVVGAGGYFWTRILLGEIYMKQSMVAMAKNDGGKAYELQIKAIGASPNMAEYRRVYSQTNLAIALNILAQKEVTDEAKQQASVLISQAVREARGAIELDNQNSAYWNNLAVIYRNLIGLIDGTADWTYQSYQQAVALEPANPILKLDLGGLLFSANRFEEAERVFEQVVVAKPDFANGWYNWAYAAKNQGKIGVAVERLTQAVALVPADSGDYEKASQELATWKKELDELVKKQQAAAEAAKPKTPETLKTAEPLPTGIEEKINMPAAELEPPPLNGASSTTPTP
ncbi:MAG: tetratricopeptide repeat protein [Candidatus Shapirobacteria bacterium]